MESLFDPMPEPDPPPKKKRTPKPPTEPEIAPYHADAEGTEIEAAIEVGKRAEAIRVQVLQFIKDAGAKGVTGDEAVQWWSIDHPAISGQGSTVLSRFTELRDHGYIRRLLDDRGKIVCRKTARNCRAAVHVWTGKAGDGSDARGKPARLKRASPFIDRASEALAVACFRAVEAGTIPTRTAICDALESWADLRFDVTDGTGIAKLRDAIASGQIGGR